MKKFEFTQDGVTATLYHGDCLEELNEVAEESVDLCLTDLPYGTMKTYNNPRHRHDDEHIKKHTWDTVIDKEKLFPKISRVLKQSCKAVLFSQEPFTTYLKNGECGGLKFIYPYYWVKDNFSNPYTTTYAPANYVEDICVFNKQYSRTGNKELRQYALDVHKYIGKPLADIWREVDKNKYIHFLGDAKSGLQFILPSRKSYDELVEFYNLKSWAGYRDYDYLRSKWEKNNGTFNIITHRHGLNHNPNYIMMSKYEGKGLVGVHPTKKPVTLLEWLVEIYTNKGDTVIDVTMGSGSTGVACLNTGRNFIGIELDDQFYQVAEERIKKAFIDNESLASYGNSHAEWKKGRVKQWSIEDFLEV